MTRQLPPFLHDMLAAPPHAGEGVHDWLFRVARQLHAHLTAGEIIVLLESRVAGCGRHVSRKEIEDAVKNSIGCAWQPQGNAVDVRSVSKWPRLNAELRAAIIRDGGGLADLWELSRPRIEDNLAHTEEMIDRLFPGNPLLCCGKSNSDFDTKPRESWRGELSQLALVVPSPMSALMGLTKEGKKSAHTLTNTGLHRSLLSTRNFGASRHDRPTL